MNKYIKIVIFGFIIWLIPFLVSFVIFPIRISMRPLFESIMPLIITIVTVTLAYYYIKSSKGNYFKDGIIAGIAWFIISIAIDLFMFLPPSPMQMGFIDYMMDIGITYLIIPVITIGIGLIADNKSKT